MEENKIDDAVAGEDAKPKIDDVLKKMGQAGSEQDKKGENSEQLEKLKDVLSQADSSSSQSFAQQAQQKKDSEEKPLQVKLSPNVEKLKEKINQYKK